MLDFYLGTGGIDNTGEHIGSLSLEAIYWLQKNNFIVKGSTGHSPEDAPESFPYFDDVVLKHEQVITVFKMFSQRMEQVRGTPGFKSEDVEALNHILTLALNKKCGLSTIAD